MFLIASASAFVICAIVLVVAAKEIASTKGIFLSGKQFSLALLALVLPSLLVGSLAPKPTANDTTASGGNVVAHVETVESEVEVGHSPHVLKMLAKYGGTMAPSADKRFDELYHAKNLERQLAVENRAPNWGMIHGKMREIRSMAAIEAYNAPFERENMRIRRELADMVREENVIIERGALLKARNLHIRRVGQAQRLMHGYHPPKREYYESTGKVSTFTTSD